MAAKYKRATMTARQLVEDYLAQQISREVTRTSTRYHLNQLLAMFGGWQARRVGAAQMQEFLAAQKARGVMGTTAHHRVRLWRTVLAWAVETGRLSASELFRLAWADVDLVAGYMRMPNAAKGAREDSRIVPIRDDILPLLRAWSAEDSRLGIQWVIHWHGRPVRCIGHAWHAARQAAGITRRITPYSLRHAMPTEALEYGADVKAVAEVMGHADPTMLLRVYQHTRYRLRKKAVNAAPGLQLSNIDS